MIMTITFKCFLIISAVCAYLISVQKYFHRGLNHLRAARLNQKVIVAGGLAGVGNDRDEVELFI